MILTHSGQPKGFQSGGAGALVRQNGVCNAILVDRVTLSAARPKVSGNAKQFTLFPQPSPALPYGFAYRPDVISGYEESRLLAKVERLTFQGISVSRFRRQATCRIRSAGATISPNVGLYRQIRSRSFCWKSAGRFKSVPGLPSQRWSRFSSLSMLRAWRSDLKGSLRGNALMREMQGGCHGRPSDQRPCASRSALAPLKRSVPDLRRIGRRLRGPESARPICTL